jgi:hypothetical protein
MKAVVVCTPLFLMLTFGSDASPAAGTDNQVKLLMRRYEQVEGQLARSVHYVRKTESDGGTKIEQAWFNGAHDLIKVAVERTGSSGRELTDYVARHFFGDEPMFILVRKETPLPDGGTQVDESRQYFNKDAVLIRELRKSGRFKPGESTDTQHVPNVVVDLAKRPPAQRSQEERRTAGWDFFSKPSNIAEALKQAGPPAFDPFATVKGDSEKFRLIHRTVSPDGRYAIALGFGREHINWDEFVDRINIFTGKEEEVKGEKIYTDRTGQEDLRNYVVDLAQQKILGETGCSYFSTEPGPLPGHISCEVEWSPDSTKFVQEWEKTYIDCVAGQIAPGPKLIGVVDLGKEIDKRTSAEPESRSGVARYLWRYASRRVCATAVR